MRKSQKEQICNIIQLLKEIHRIVKARVCKSQDDFILQMSDLVNECQVTADILIDVIEKSEESDCLIIKILKEYRKSIEALFYQESEKSLLLLEQLEFNIMQKVSVRKEVVFLPYKASMWDSLESVWLAAKEDPECDAYVVPIPYYEKNADGTFGALHYEGDLYPDYVPIVDYREYLIEERKPEMIFIHNPYDEYNTVTSIHPNFYSSRIKFFTDKLVYIPYFILNEVEPDDDIAVNQMKHFCLTAGVVNADEVIVQSEKMRLVYIKVLTENFGEQSREQWESKIKGLGSPKLDKVSRTKKDEVLIPDSWKNIIQKNNGEQKKIILYNTSLSTFLKEYEGYLEKLENVLQFFKNNKEDVVLLWRPHPLLEQTINSMRPHLLEKYKGIVKSYQKENWGIYDNSAELDRAIALADAYYGDASSVVQLCQQAGIPVMIQNIDIRY